MDHIDVVFIKPVAARLYGDLGAFDLPAIEAPLQAALLAAILRERGHSVAILDPEVEGWDMAETARRAADLHPTLAVLVAAGANPSASTMSMDGVRATVSALRTCEPPFPILLAGLHPTALPERTMREENVDYLCLGEGFRTLPELVDALKAGDTAPAVAGLWYRRDGVVVRNPMAPLLASLDTLPVPAWDLLPMRRYRAHNWHCFGHITQREPYAVIYTTLGCPFRCHFCCTNALFGSHGIRYRSPELVVREIDMLVNTHGIRNIKIQDEMFVFHRDHVTQLCDLIAGRGYDLNIWAYTRVNTARQPLLDKMRRAGIRWLAFGFESGKKEVLEAATKGYAIDSVDDVVRMTYDAGIHILGNYMFGLPDDDEASMQDTLDLALRINAEWANFYTVMALPGSRLYDEALEKGWKLPDTWAGYSQYGYDCQPLPTRSLTPAQVLAFRDRAFHTYYEYPPYLEKIERQFGADTLAHVRQMASHTLKRRLTEGM